MCLDAEKPTSNLAELFSVSSFWGMNMRSHRAWFVRLLLVAAAIGITGVVAARVPLATDWSHRHLVFSQPGSLLERFRFSTNPRYVQQYVRRNAGNRERPARVLPMEPIQADWSQNMGTGATVGAGQYPAKFSFDVNSASCSTDYVAFNSGLAGSSTKASVIAFSNLYTGCTGTVPATKWAYDTGGTATTSLALSGDGSQIAFVQAQGGVATLVLLKWAASTTETAGAPLVLSATSNSGYRSCTAPCMTTIAFNGSPTDTLSAPFYDFTPGSDSLYVGDDTGHLHQFTGIFYGTPAEAGSPWPVLVATAKLSSPVYDAASGNVFVTTSYQTSNNSGARLDAICATSACAGMNNGSATTAIGTATPSLVLGPTKTSSVACHGTGASGNANNLNLDGPIVDPAAGKVYVFLGNNGNGNSAVIQFSTTVSSTQFSFHSCGAEATVGTASTAGVPMFAGNFDNVYYASANGGSPSGNLYVCGNTSGNATLYQIRITSNAIAASGSSVLAVSTANTTCSPITEADNGATDLIFLSVQNLGSTSATVKCPSNTGCVMSLSVPTTIAGALPTATTATLAASGGTSGIVIDNLVTPGTLQTSRVYYSTLTGNTAVQASQAGLK
jgi:hypothetical protein